jgi:polyhydroxyalkanoate synthesis regulator phasin
VKRFRRALVVAGCVAVIAVLFRAPEAIGQQPGGGQPEPSRITSVDFPGGKLKDYVALLKKSATRPVNVVISGTEDVTLPPISLKDVSLAAAVGIVEYIEPVEMPLNVETIWSGEGGGPAFPAQLEGNQVFVVRPRNPQLSPGERRAEPTPTIAVFSLRSLLEAAPGTPDLPVTRTDSASLLTAVETALTMGGGQKAEMKFHPETGVLVVRGTPTQTMAVQTLLAEVNGDLQRFRVGATDARLKEAELQADVRRAEVDVASARAEVEAAVEGLKQMDQMVKEGHMSASEAAKATLAIKQREANVARAQIQQEMAVQMWQAWRDGAAERSGPATPEGLRREIKRLEGVLDTMRAELRKLEGPTR